MRKLKVLLSVGAMISAGPLAAASSDQVIIVTGEQADAATAKLDNGVANLKVLDDPGGTITLSSRNTSTTPEMHEHVGHMLIGKAGHMTIVMGGVLKGAVEVSPGEWRKGKISGGKNVELSPGAMVWMPPGTPHRYQMQSKDPVSYYVVRYLEPEATTAPGK